MKTLLLLTACAALGVATAAAVGSLFERSTPTRTSSLLYVLVEPGPASTAEAVSRGVVRSGDLMHVAVRARPGAYVSLLAFDGRGRLVETAPANDAPPEGGWWQTRLHVDEHPGREQVVALVASRALNLRLLLRRANAAPNRAERLRLLGMSAAQVLSGPVFAHREYPPLSRNGLAGTAGTTRRSASARPPSAGPASS